MLCLRWLAFYLQLSIVPNKCLPQLITDPFKLRLETLRYVFQSLLFTILRLPSAPSAHRPDLIESTAVYDELKTDEYAELPFQVGGLC